MQCSSIYGPERPTLSDSLFYLTSMRWEQSEVKKLDKLFPNAWKKATQNQKRSEVAAEYFKSYRITQQLDGEYLELHELCTYCIRMLFSDCRKINRELPSPLANIQPLEGQLIFLEKTFSIYCKLIPKFQEMKLNRDRLFDRLWEFFILHSFSILCYAKKNLLNERCLGVLTKHIFIPPETHSLLAERFRQEKYQYLWLRGNQEIHRCKLLHPVSSIHFNLSEWLLLYMDRLAKKKHDVDELFSEESDGSGYERYLRKRAEFSEQRSRRLMETGVEELLKIVENSPESLEVFKSVFNPTLKNPETAKLRSTHSSKNTLAFYQITEYLELVGKCSCIPREQKTIFQLINGINSLIHHLNHLRGILSHFPKYGSQGKHPDAFSIPFTFSIPVSFYIPDDHLRQDVANHASCPHKRKLAVIVEESRNVIGKLFYAEWHQFLLSENLRTDFSGFPTKSSALSGVSKVCRFIPWAFDFDTRVELDRAVLIGSQIAAWLKQEIRYMLSQNLRRIPDLKNSLMQMSDEIESIIPLLDFQPAQKVSESIRREEWYREEWGPWLIPEQSRWKISQLFSTGFCKTMGKLAGLPQTTDVTRKKAEALAQRIIQVVGEKRKKQTEFAESSVQWEEYGASMDTLHRAFGWQIQILSRISEEGSGQTLGEQINSLAIEIFTCGFLNNEQLSIETLQRRYHYARMGYSMVDELNKLMSERNFDFQQEIHNFFVWAKKHPKASQEMMGDIFQTLNILFSETGFMERFSNRMTLQYYAHNLLDALGAFYDAEPLESSQELRYRAIADIWHCAPLFAVTLTKTFNAFRQSDSVYGLVKRLLINLPQGWIEAKAIQTFANRINAEYTPLIAPFVKLVSGEDFGKALQTHQELVILRQLSKLSHSFFNPEETVKRLGFEWKVWKDSLLKSKGRERVWRVLTNVGIPLAFSSLSLLALQQSILTAIFPYIPAFAVFSATAYYFCSRLLDFLYANWHLKAAKKGNKKRKDVDVKGYIENHQKAHLLPRPESIAIPENYLTEELGEFKDQLMEKVLRDLQENDQLPFELIAAYNKTLDPKTLRKEISKELEGFVAYDHVEKQMLEDYLLNEVRTHCLNEWLKPALVRSFNRLRDQILEKKLEKEWGWKKDREDEQTEVSDPTLEYLEQECKKTTLQKSHIAELIKIQANEDMELKDHPDGVATLSGIFVNL
ncbi:MAG: hypothetical protein WB791_06325 [Waddliaceae bacterium]